MSQEIITIENQLNYTILSKSDSDIIPLPSDTVHVKYSTWMSDVLIEEEKLFSFVVGRGHVIRGWDRVLMLMGVGDVVMLECPAEYAYGEAGSFCLFGDG
eukprot:TRINITY_DN5220_c0_g1_i2.p1 TRINITY_DN5220_c0_g1~~TRINITY_DN5220_c0_g1_i2.p1  ORF type:complete len:113 (-),score=29.40 TRINITY_DN5220_c0_g1_i2:31-330(-)